MWNFFMHLGNDNLVCIIIWNAPDEFGNIATVKIYRMWLIAWKLHVATSTLVNMQGNCRWKICQRCHICARDWLRFALVFFCSHQGELPGLMRGLQQAERRLVEPGGAILQQHIVCSWQRWGQWRPDGYSVFFSFSGSLMTYSDSWHSDAVNDRCMNGDFLPWCPSTFLSMWHSDKLVSQLMCYIWNKQIYLPLRRTLWNARASSTMSNRYCVT